MNETATLGDLKIIKIHEGNPEIQKESTQLFVAHYTHEIVLFWWFVWFFTVTVLLWRFIIKGVVAKLVSS